MAPLPHFLLLFSFFASTLLASHSHSHSHSLQPHIFLGRRNLLGNKNNVDNDVGDDFLGELVPRKNKVSTSDQTDSPSRKKSPTSSSSDKKKTVSSNEGESTTPTNKKSEDGNNDEPKKKKSSNSAQINTIIIKPTLSSSSAASSISSKNKTKVIKPTLKGVNSNNNNNNNNTSSTPTKLKLVTTNTNNSKKLNSTSKPSDLKKPLDLLKSNNNSAAKNKTKSPTNDKPKSQNQDQKRETPSSSSSSSSWAYQDNDEDEDLVSEFRDLPTKFHQSFIPDLRRISTSSKVYLTKYNKEFTKGFKPYVGNKYAASLATAISCIFIIVPFLLVSLVFNRIKSYFSLQKLIIFVQIYLSIYFSILCFSSLVTGLEPLRFFYATSQSTYVWLQVLQTLAYVLYLLLLIMYLVLVFSTETELGQRFLGLAQTMVGFAVGLHYYMTVFHRVVLRQPPKTNWKIHGIYATCFLVICVFVGAERRKKAYLVEGSEQGKTS